LPSSVAAIARTPRLLAVVPSEPRDDVEMARRAGRDVLRERQRYPGVATSSGKPKPAA
jgi:hypothetical protein